MAKKQLKFKDLKVAPNCALYDALENKDMKLAEKLYKELNTDWKKMYGDWQPPKRESLKFYQD
jgi:hypothetical protein